MREFKDIYRDAGLKKFLESSLGTLYAVPVTRENPRPRRLMVRHFDSKLPVALVGTFADLVRATQSWVERHPQLERLVRVLQPIEVGKDFIAREYLVYYTSTSTYVESEDPPEPPPELEEMRDIFRGIIGTSADPKDVIIESVLARSLLEPSAKTVFTEDEGKFLVIEPKPTREELERWAALTPAATD
jgi:hypothetical protein